MHGHVASNNWSKCHLCLTKEPHNTKTTFTKVVQCFWHISKRRTNTYTHNQHVNIDEIKSLSFTFCFYSFQQDELDTRPKASTFVSSFVNYQNTIPAATDPDAKPPPPSARMGKFNFKIINKILAEYCYISVFFVWIAPNLLFSINLLHFSHSLLAFIGFIWFCQLFSHRVVSFFWVCARSTSKWRIKCT